MRLRQETIFCRYDPSRSHQRCCPYFRFFTTVVFYSVSIDEAVCTSREAATESLRFLISAGPGVAVGADNGSGGGHATAATR